MKRTGCTALVYGLCVFCQKRSVGYEKQEMDDIAASGCVAA